MLRGFPMDSNPYPDDHMAPLDELPAGIRNRIGPALPDRHAVWTCLRKNGRGGAHTEWWWIDDRGDLVEAF